MSEEETLCRRADGTGAVRTVLKSRIPGLPYRPSGFRRFRFYGTKFPPPKGTFAVAGLAGCAAYGCKPRLLASMNVPGASAPGTLENMGSLIVLPSARPSGSLGIPGRSKRSGRSGYLPHLGNGSCGFGQNSLVKWNRMSGNFSCASDSV